MVECGKCDYTCSICVDDMSALDHGFVVEMDQVRIVSVDSQHLQLFHHTIRVNECLINT